MSSIDLLAVASERHQAVAATWAALFCKDEPGKKPEFINHYIARTLIHRFWARSSVVNDQKIAVCRLGDDVMLAFHKGQIVKLKITGEKVVGLQIPSSSIGPTKQMARFLKSIQMKLQSPRKKSATAFDSLTSFSKQAANIVLDTLTSDIPKSFGIYPSKNSRYAGYLSVRTKNYFSNYGMALKQFLSEVDQSILFTIRSIRCPSISVYNWLADGQSERRLQALRAYPVLIPMEIVLDGGHATDPETLIELTSLIDRGESFFPLLATIHHTTPSVIKKIGRLSPYVVGSALSLLKYEFTRHEVQALIACFSLGTKRPKTRKGWKTCLSTMQSISLDFNESNLAGMPAWESDEWVELTPQIRSLYDIGRCRVILAARSIKSALSFSREWHEKRSQIQTELLSTGAFKASSWPGMLKGDVQHPETGLTFTEILNDLALTYEGEAMGHCVGGYSNKCFDARSRIISIRDGKTSLATLQYRIDISKTGRKSYRCVQAQGPGNTPLKKKPQAALDWFTKNLRKFVATYELPVVPHSLRPEGKANLSEMVMEQMVVWVNIKMEKLGLREQMEAWRNQNGEFYDY
jgi:hypothetical protein